MKTIKSQFLLFGVMLVINACSSMDFEDNSPVPLTSTVMPIASSTIDSTPTVIISPSFTNTTSPSKTPIPSSTPSQEPVISATPDDLAIIDKNTVCHGAGDTVIYLVTGARKEFIYVAWVDAELTYMQEIRRIPFCNLYSNFPSGAQMFLEASYQEVNVTSEIKCQIFYMGEKVAEDIVNADSTVEDKKATCFFLLK